MNGRVFHAASPEARLTAAFHILIERWVVDPAPHYLDYPDLAAALRPVIERELLLARAEESSAPQTVEHRKRLVDDLIAAERAVLANPLWRIGLPT